jgi:hypothetical protein
MQTLEHCERNSEINTTQILNVYGFHDYNWGAIELRSLVTHFENMNPSDWIRTNCVVLEYLNNSINPMKSRMTHNIKVSRQMFEPSVLRRSLNRKFKRLE